MRITMVRWETKGVFSSSLTKMAYGWSKYGGPMYGLKKDEGDWHCQACGQAVPSGMPEYMLPIDPTQREFVRICSICKHIQVKSRMGYQKLIILVRNQPPFG